MQPEPVLPDELDELLYVMLRYGCGRSLTEEEYALVDQMRNRLATWRHYCQHVTWRQGP